MRKRYMARREFLQRAGMSAACVFCGRTVSKAGFSPGSGGLRHSPDSLEQARSKQGRISVRFEMGKKAKEVVLSVRLNVDGAKIARAEKYFFEAGEDEFLPEQNAWRCRTTGRFYSSSPSNQEDVDVVVLWLEQARRDSRISAKVNDRALSFSLGELHDKGQITEPVDGSYISANLLYYSEIGEIDPAKVKIKDAGDDFDFIIFADTHAGIGNSAVNAYIAKNVELVNELRPSPRFVIIDGDIVTDQGQKENYQTVLPVLERLKVPVLFEVGNHETKYRSRFSPGYNMTAFKNYFEAQRQINGMDKLLYSFDLGRWHFVVWPDPLRRHFWVTHPHYFDWLEKDLEKNKDRPTIFFQHVHSLPLGINPMTNYVNSTQVRRMLLDIITRYGNVKYVFSGHTHITVKGSFKTARTYRGTNFINLAPTANPTRNFGEPDFDGRGSQGFTIVNIRGEKITVNYRMTEGKTYTYPAEFAEFDPDAWPLWLKNEWELPAHKAIVNGGFENGLAGWAGRFIYMEDENPSNIRRVDSSIRHSGANSLYLYCRRRGYYVPGDNRMTQTLNNIRQAVRMKAGTTPIVNAWYLLDGEGCAAGGKSGACIRVEGYKGSSRRMRLCYWIGTGYFKPRGLWSPWEEYLHYDITASPDKWHKVMLNVEKDYEAAVKGKKFDELGLDKLTVTLGVWNLNQHTEEDKDKPMRIGVYFDDIDVAFAEGDAAIVSTVDGRAVGLKHKDEIESRWLMGGMGNERERKSKK